MFIVIITWVWFLADAQPAATLFNFLYVYISYIYIYFQQDDCYFLRNLDLLVHLILSQRQRQSFGPIALLHHYLRILRWRQRCDGGERDASNRQSSLCLSSRTLTGKKAESRRHNAIYSLIRGNVQVKNDGLSFSNANTNRYTKKTQTRRRELKQNDSIF